MATETDFDDFDFKKGEPVKKVSLGRAQFSFQFHSSYGPCCITHWVEAPLEVLRAGGVVPVRHKNGGEVFAARIHTVDQYYRKDEAKEQYIYVGN